MSIADIASSMQQIQLQLAQLGGTAAPARTTNAASAANFADALSNASAPTAASAASATGTPASGSVTGQDVVQSALKYVGTPYVLGGESKSGIDCSGLVQRAFGDLGVNVPRLVHQQQTIGTAVPSLKDAKPGDLVVLNGGDHIAIWLGNNTVVHAPYEGRTVSVQKAWFTDKDVVTIRRVVPSESAATTGATAATAAATSAISAEQSALLAIGGSDAASSTGSSDATSSDPTSSFLSGLTNSLGVSGTSSSSTVQQLLAARAAMLEGAA